MDGKFCTIEQRVEHHFENRLATSWETHVCFKGEGTTKYTVHKRQTAHTHAAITDRSEVDEAPSQSSHRPKEGQPKKEDIRLAS